MAAALCTDTLLAPADSFNLAHPDSDEQRRGAFETSDAKAKALLKQRSSSYYLVHHCEIFAIAGIYASVVLETTILTAKAISRHSGGCCEQASKPASQPLDILLCVLRVHYRDACTKYTSLAGNNESSC